MLSIFLLIIGLVTGSFLGAFTFRLPRGISIAKGRSFCPQCKNTISWYDNIPLLSFIFLSGRCRACHKKISSREPLIELLTGTIFFFIGLRFPSISLFLIYILIIVFIMIALFVIDWEHQILPDFLTFAGLLMVIGYKVLSHDPNLYLSLLAGLTAASFLLTIHLLTRGRGMGLGDVKLAIFAGSFLGFPGMVVWLFGSFVIGALVGIALILFRNKKLKDAIAFGPFLVISFFILLFFPQLVVTFMNSLVR